MVLVAKTKAIFWTGMGINTVLLGPSLVTFTKMVCNESWKTGSTKCWL